MKKIIALITMTVLCFASLSAKELKVLTVKTSPEMHCNGCETKIKNNIRFVSGVKKIVTDLEKKEVAVTYDAEKTSADKIIEAFKKIGYTTTTVSDKEDESHKADDKTKNAPQKK